MIPRTRVMKSAILDTLDQHFKAAQELYLSHPDEGLACFERNLQDAAVELSVSDQQVWRAAFDSVSSTTLTP